MTPSVAVLAKEDPQAFLARALLIAGETINNLKMQAMGLETAGVAGSTVLLREWLKEGINSIETLGRRAATWPPRWPFWP
ncbi:hypothetical protein ACHMXK_13595 [Polaromonas sp. UC242_47]